MDTTAEQSQHLVDKVSRAIAQSRPVANDVRARVGVSCGVAEIRDGDDAASWFERADRDLYAAKNDQRYHY